MNKTKESRQRGLIGKEDNNKSKIYGCSIV